MVKDKKNSKAIFNKGDHVVYPSYGPGKILAIKKEIIIHKINIKTGGNYYGYVGWKRKKSKTMLWV